MGIFVPLKSFTGTESPSHPLIVLAFPQAGVSVACFCVLQATVGPLLVQPLLQLLTGFRQVPPPCHPCLSERWKLPMGISWEPGGEETAPSGRVNGWLWKHESHRGSSVLYPHSPSWRDKNSYQVRILWCHPTSFWTESLTVFVAQHHLPHRHQIWATLDLHSLNCLCVHRKGLFTAGAGISPYFRVEGAGHDPRLGSEGSFMRHTSS